MDEEANWAEEANRQRKMIIQRAETKQKRQAQGKWVVIILSLAGLIGAWNFYRKFGKKPVLPAHIQMTSDIPAKTPPVLVGYLLNNREIYGGAMVSTLLDLARRGYIVLREEEEGKKKLFGGTKKTTQYVWDLKRDYWRENASKLEKYEDELIRFIFDGLAGGENSIDIREIKKQQSKFRKFFVEWKKYVKKIGEEQHWFDKKSTRGMLYSIGLGTIMILLTGAAAFLFEVWAVILGAASVVVFILSFMIPHRTKKGEMLAQQWKALKRYLQKYHYRAADQTILLARIDDYFVYGLVLGLSEKIFKELAGYIPAEAYNTYLPWYVYHGGGMGSFTPDAFASAFSSMIATTTSAMSTASGAGGGASVGGGGGASSGGGGAG